MPARDRGIALLALVLAAVLAACGADASRTVAVTDLVGRKARELVVWLGPATSLHPHEAPVHLTSALFSPLVISDPVTRLPSWGPDAPGALLQSVTSGDLQTWSLEVKQGWRWHDGTPVTADDVVRGVETAIRAGSPLASTVAEITATGTIATLRLTAPFGQLPHLLTHPTFLPLPPLAASSPSQFAASPVGNGPYRLTGRQGRAYQLEAVAGHPLADRVDVGRAVVELTDEPSATADLAIGADGQPADPLTAVGRTQLLHLPGRQLAYLAFPLTDDRYADVDVRTALALALDVPAIAAAVGGDDVVPADRLVGPGFARTAQVACATCSHDPERAAELWPDDLGGPLTIWYARGAGHEPLVEAVAGAWSRVLGADDIQLAELPAEDLLARLGENEVSGPFRLAWQADVASPSRLLEPLFGPRGSANDSRYRSGVVEAALRTAGLQRDLVAALEAYAQVEAAVLADVPLIPLWHSTVPVSARADVDGIVLDGEGRLDWTRLRR